MAHSQTVWVFLFRENLGLSAFVCVFVRSFIRSFGGLVRVYLPHTDTYLPACLLACYYSNLFEHECEWMFVGMCCGEMLKHLYTYIYFTGQFRRKFSLVTLAHIANVNVCSGSFVLLLFFFFAWNEYQRRRKSFWHTGTRISIRFLPLNMHEFHTRYTRHQTTLHTIITLAKHPFRCESKRRRRMYS